MRKAITFGAAMLTSVGAAHAQSNVSVYGVIDMFGQYLDSAAHLARVQSGGSTGSRLGFRGTEDLGDGFKALFTLEMGLNGDDGTLGQGGLVFGRQAFVGLSDRWGELTLGRQYGSTYRLGSDFSAFGIGSYGPSTQTIGGFAGGYEPFRGASSTSVPPAAGATGNGSPSRINNSVRYASPSWDGVQATAIVGLGEAGSTQDNRIYDLALRYTRGPVDAIVMVVSDKRTAGATPADTSTLGWGGTWSFGGAYKLFAGYVAVDDKRAENLDGRGHWLGGEYRWGSQLVRAQWIQNKPRYGSDNKTTAFGIGYQYDLSKRTALYSSLTRFDNGANVGAAGSGRFFAPIPAGLTTQPNNDITEMTLGIRHSF